jgi:hypothetical protein
MLSWGSYRGYIIEMYTSWVGQRDDSYGLIFNKGIFHQYKMKNMIPSMLEQLKQQTGVLLGAKGGSGQGGGSSFAGSSGFVGIEFFGWWQLFRWGWLFRCVGQGVRCLQWSPIQFLWGRGPPANFFCPPFVPTRLLL